MAPDGTHANPGRNCIADGWFETATRFGGNARSTKCNGCKRSLLCPNAMALRIPHCLHLIRDSELFELSALELSQCRSQHDGDLFRIASTKKHKRSKRANFISCMRCDVRFTKIIILLFIANEMTGNKVLSHCVSTARKGEAAVTKRACNRSLLRLTPHRRHGQRSQGQPLLLKCSTDRLGVCGQWHSSGNLQTHRETVTVAQNCCHADAIEEQLCCLKAFIANLHERRATRCEQTAQ